MNSRLEQREESLRILKELHIDLINQYDVGTLHVDFGEVGDVGGSSTVVSEPVTECSGESCFEELVWSQDVDELTRILRSLDLVLSVCSD